MENIIATAQAAVQKRFDERKVERIALLIEKRDGCKARLDAINKEIEKLAQLKYGEQFADEF